MENSYNVMRRAVSREYNYYILNSETRSPLRDRFYYQVPRQLNIPAMNEAAQALVGEHDFASFVNHEEAAKRNTVKNVLKSEVKKDGDTVIFNIIANGFLMHQVRNTVGCLVKVGQGKMSVAEYNKILDAKQPCLAAPTAPAGGLCLIKVNYPSSVGRNVEDGKL